MNNFKIGDKVRLKDSISGLGIMTFSCIIKDINFDGFGEEIIFIEYDD